MFNNIFNKIILKFVTKLDVIACIILFLFSASFLFFTSSPTISWWSSPLYAQNAYFLSIPYQGESIFYILLGRVFTSILLWLPSVKSVILLSIFCASSASLFFYLSIRDLLSFLHQRKHTISSRLAAFSISMSVPFLYSVWNYTVIADCYILGLLITSILIWLSIRIWTSQELSERWRLFLLVCFILGIDFSSHRLNLPYIISAAILLIFPLRNLLNKPVFYIQGIVFLIFGLSLHIYLIARGINNDLTNMGTVRNFNELISWIRMDSNPDSNLSILFNRRAPLWSYQINHMYLRYLIWNILGYKLSVLSIVQLMFAITGIFWTFANRFKIAFILFCGWLGYSICLVLYLNIWNNFFREIDRLFLPSFLIFYIWSAIGVWFIICMLSKKILHRTYRPILLSIFIAVMIFVPLSPIIQNFRYCNKSFYTFPYDIAWNYLQGCRKNAILFTAGDNDTFPLQYLQKTDKIRQDVSVINIYMLQSYEGIQKLLKYAPSLSPILPNSKENFNLLSSKLASKKDSISIENYLTNELIRFYRPSRSVYFSKFLKPESMIKEKCGFIDAGLATALTDKYDIIEEISVLENNLLHTYKYNNFDNSKVLTEGIDVSTQYFIILQKSFLKLKADYSIVGNNDLADVVFQKMKSYLPVWRFPKN